MNCMEQQHSISVAVVSNVNTRFYCVVFCVCRYVLLMADVTVQCNEQFGYGSVGFVWTICPVLFTARQGHAEIFNSKSIF